MGFYQYIVEQKINSEIKEVWDFISSPSNLKKITPEYMGFNITSSNITEKMYPGMIISYKVTPLFGIKTTWVTEITHVKENHYFVDEQRVGPYTMWHHEHILIKIDNGVLMKDIVSYKPPMGFVGSIANSIIIKRKLKEIFNFRRHSMDKIFGEYTK